MSTSETINSLHMSQAALQNFDVPSQKAYDRSVSVVRGLFSLCDITIDGLDQVPKPPFILASTHRGFKDIFALGITFRDIGRIQFMAKEELFKNSLIGNHLLRTGAFPINREKPKSEQLDRAFSVLRAPEDSILGIFPEGSIKYGPDVETPKSSFAIMALAAQVPIVVAAVAGPELTPKSVFPSDLHVHIGGVIDIPDVGMIYKPGVSLLRAGAKHSATVREISAQTQELMQSSLAAAQEAYNPQGTSIRYLDQRLYPFYA